MKKTEFYYDAHWVRMRHGSHDEIIANVFDTHDAKVLVELLNELIPYKFLVRKHKRDLEAIYGKSIKEQLEEVINDE